MKIIIAGAGSVGYHLGKLLSKENQDITIIDKNELILEEVASDLDVMTLLGNATSLDILEQAKVKNADLFIAVTTSEETNLLTATLAKQEGAKFTIARVSNTEFLKDKQKDFFKKIGVDRIISPQNLAAQEIKRLIKRASLTDNFDFENGELSIVGFTIDNNSNLVSKQIGEMELAKSGISYRAVALSRNYETMIPSSTTILNKGDHLYLSIRSEHIDKVVPYLGKQSKKIKEIMIVGDTLLVSNTAKLLQNDYNIKVILKDLQIGKEFLKSLKNCLVIVGDPGKKELLEEEGLKNMDAFIALTPDSEINILSCLLAEEAGVYRSIALVDNDLYTHISRNIGVDTIINKKLIAANDIFRFVRKGNIEAIASLLGVNAEIIEFEIKQKNKAISKSISELGLPKASIIAGVIRNHKSIIPNGDFIINKEDKVVVFVMPEAIATVEKIFSV